MAIHGANSTEHALRSFCVAVATYLGLKVRAICCSNWPSVSMQLLGWPWHQHNIPETLKATDLA